MKNAWLAVAVLALLALAGEQAEAKDECPPLIMANRTRVVIREYASGVVTKGPGCRWIRAHDVVLEFSCWYEPGGMAPTCLPSSEKSLKEAREALAIH